MATKNGKNTTAMSFVDQWRDPRYKQDAESMGYPFVQWNAKNIQHFPMHITKEQADLAGWIGESKTWSASKFTYEKKIGKPLVTLDVYECNTPIISVVKLYRRRWVYRTNTVDHKKGDLKPEYEPVDKKLHILQQSYIVGLLEKASVGYKLLHNSPLSWTPKGVVGARFGLECYRPFVVSIQRSYGLDVPRFIFALPIIPKLSVVGESSEQVEIWVPTLGDTALDNLYVGDETAATLKEWYHSVAEVETDEIPDDNFASFESVEMGEDYPM